MYVSEAHLFNRLKPGRFGASLRKTFRRYLIEIICGVILMGAAIYIVTFGVQIASGVSRTIDVPSQVVRLQIVDASGERSALGAVADAVANYRDTDIEIEIASRERFSIRKISESMVVSRTEDLSAAKLLAARIGLDPEVVLFQPLESNRDHVTVTLILGTDYPGIVSAVRTGEETAH